MNLLTNADKEEKEYLYRRAIAALRYHDRMKLKYDSEYKGSSLQQDTLNSVDFLKECIENL